MWQSGSEVQGSLGGDAEDGGFPVHGLGAGCWIADDVAFEVGVATGLHVPVAKAEAEAEVGGNPVVEHRLQLVAPAMAIFGDRPGETATLAANAQVVPVVSSEQDQRQAGCLAA